MIHGSFTIGQIAGIKISIHWTFFILIALVLIPGKETEIWWNLAFVLAVFLCIVMHELGHAIAARSYGIKTKDITLLPIGGVARLEKMPEKPRQELAVAIAGPLVNIIIAGILFPFIREGIQGNIFIVTVVDDHNFLMSLFAINLSLAAFNLVPAFPMDGGRVLRALLSFKLNKVRATQIAAGIGQFMAVLLGILGFYFNPLLIFIALFIFFSAQQERYATESKALLSGYTAKDVTMKQFAVCQADEPLSSIVAALLDSQSTDFVVYHEGRVAGTIGRDEIIKALSRKNDDTLVRDVMNTKWQVANPTTSLEEIYERMMKNQSLFILVVNGNTVEGVVDMENILEFIMVKQATLPQSMKMVGDGVAFHT